MADDIVTRLRVIHCAADDLTPCGTCLTCQAADEIERLRAAGDALAEAYAWIMLHHEQIIDDPLVKWRDVRRG